MSPVERSSQIYAILDEVTDPLALRNSSSVQGKAAKWLIQDDGLVVCPDNVKLIQRFALATIYYATNGDNWFKCSGNQLASDNCGGEAPFWNETRFLSPVNECQWAGIVCNVDFCVTELEYGKTSLTTTLPLLNNKR
jgi:hypothetical protein